MTQKNTSLTSKIIHGKYGKSASWIYVDDVKEAVRRLVDDIAYGYEIYPKGTYSYLMNKIREIFGKELCEDEEVSNGNK